MNQKRKAKIEIYTDKMEWICRQAENDDNNFCYVHLISFHHLSVRKIHIEFVVRGRTQSKSTQITM